MLGELVLPAGGAAWTSTLVAALATVGIAEKNARQAVARLADQGLLVGHRHGRLVRWELSGEGRSLLEEGTARIYGFLTEPPTWDGRWLIVTFSVPEEQRGRRHQLRQRLAFAGFGFPGAGVAVCAHLEREAAASAALRDLGVDDGAIVFRGEAGDLAGDAELVRRAWDLEGLAARYDAFMARFAALPAGTDEATVGALIHLVHEWRRFPFVDPELPAELLAAGWPGHRARTLFDRRHGEWVAVARQWFAALDSGT